MAFIDVKKLVDYWKPVTGIVVIVVSILMFYQGKIDTTSLISALTFASAWAVYHHTSHVVKKNKGTAT